MKRLLVAAAVGAAVGIAILAVAIGVGAFLLHQLVQGGYLSNTP